ncbi:cobalt-precorrin 5A hydrolase [Sulfitobacter brevis]|uniref:Cobalt-precorrin 5A hydrolase n=1 Tax=Sulfitobacter brevis TaxID=74348 RepID=A0A1I1VX79_9RHOB|nr:cobalamin biosynthesis protein [Sulfitobacter brevis]SFD87577.1 cobalt-precorrin 5A hydrolase [Sulfitobacter brevis]
MRVAGIGFRSAASLPSLVDALQRALAEAGGGTLDALVTESAKSREPVFRELAQSMGLPGLGVTQQDLGQMITPTQSQRIQDQFGTGSLAEAAALAAAGPEATLAACRVVSGDGMATAAIADSQRKDPR